MSEHERPKIKVTDRRRVRPDRDAAAAAARGPRPEAGDPEVGGAVDRPGEAAAKPEAAPVGASEADPHAEIDDVRRKASEYLDHLQRLKAEFDNYRKRVLKEQTRAVEMASEPFVRRLLEVLDEFDLALMAAEKKPDFDKFLHGIELVYAKLKDILRAEGVEPIDAEGKPFDPEQHEALMQSGDGDGDPVVADVLRRGYTMKGRVIRPAGVRVAPK